MVKYCYMSIERAGRKFLRGLLVLGALNLSGCQPEEISISPATELPETSDEKKRGGIITIPLSVSIEEYCELVGDLSPLPSGFQRSVFLRGINDPKVLIPRVLKGDEEDVVMDRDGPGITEYKTMGFVVLHDPDESFLVAARADLCEPKD